MFSAIEEVTEPITVYVPITKVARVLFVLSDRRSVIRWLWEDRWWVRRLTVVQYSLPRLTIRLSPDL